MAAGQRCEPGGIQQLVGLIDEHRGAVEYDCRARLHFALADVDDSVTACELARLVRVLAGDSSTHIAAALAGWDHPMSREAIILADLWDLQYARAGVKNRKPYPRPWGTRTVQQMRPNRSVSQASVLSALRRAGHDT